MPPRPDGRRRNKNDHERLRFMDGCLAADGQAAASLALPRASKRLPGNSRVDAGRNTSAGANCLWVLRLPMSNIGCPVIIKPWFHPLKYPWAQTKNCCSANCGSPLYMFAKTAQVDVPIPITANCRVSGWAVLAATMIKPRAVKMLRALITSSNFGL
jgi:hypothetical protein